MTIARGGMTVARGGMTVACGGMTVAKEARVAAGRSDLTGNLSVYMSLGTASVRAARFEGEFCTLTGQAEGKLEQHPKFLRSGLNCYLFIYLVRGSHDGACDYCTVLAYGRSLKAAEQVAINRVHQQGLHIVRADTATAAPWLDPASDGAYLAELAQYGSALRQSTGSATAA